MSELSNAKKAELREKEELLRGKLNEASDDVERDLLKTLAMAAVGGIVSFILYKVMSGNKSDDIANKDKTKRRKKNKNLKRHKENLPLKKSSIWKNKAIETAIKNGLPFAINFLEDYLSRNKKKKAD